MVGVFDSCEMLISYLLLGRFFLPQFASIVTKTARMENGRKFSGLLWFGGRE